jgi:hypothetical protein
MAQSEENIKNYAVNATPKKTNPPRRLMETLEINSRLEEEWALAK